MATRHGRCEIGGDAVTTVFPPLQTPVYRAPADLVNGLDPLFTVSGGPVCAIVWGRVTTVLGASGSVVKLVADPTVGTDSDLSAAAGFSMSGFAAGRWVGRWMLALAALAASPGNSADEVAAAAVFGGLAQQFGAIIAPGSISLNATAAQTGQMEWYCLYIPLVPGAFVVAA